MTQDQKNAQIELLLFSRDLKPKTDAEIEQALSGWKNYPMRTLFSDWWLNREGKPFQQSIEAHVEGYRLPPRDFCGDLNLCVDVLQPRLEELGLRFGYITFLSGSRHYVMGEWHCLNLSAEQRVDAALAALQAQQPAQGDEAHAGESAAVPGAASGGEAGTP